MNARGMRRYYRWETHILIGLGQTHILETKELKNQRSLDLYTIYSLVPKQSVHTDHSSPLDLFHMALTLPEPNQHFEGEDDLAPKARTQNEGMAQLKKSEELLKGIIYPSREIRG